MTAASELRHCDPNDTVIAITVAGGRLEQVDSFVYLGSKVRNDADCTDEVKLRMAMGTMVVVKLTKMWKNKSLSTLLNCA